RNLDVERRARLVGLARAVDPFVVEGAGHADVDAQLVERDDVVQGTEQAGGLHLTQAGRPGGALTAEAIVPGALERSDISAERLQMRLEIDLHAALEVAKLLSACKRAFFRRRSHWAEGEVELRILGRSPAEVLDEIVWVIVVLELRVAERALFRHLDGGLQIA